MERYSLADAQAQLQKLMQDARNGKTVVILDENEMAVQLVPVPMPTTTLKPRRLGSARGLIKMSEDFDDPLPEFDEYMK